MENLHRLREYLSSMRTQHMSKGDYVSACRLRWMFAFCTMRGRWLMKIFKQAVVQANEIYMIKS